MNNKKTGILRRIRDAVKSPVLLEKTPIIYLLWIV